MPGVAKQILYRSRMLHVVHRLWPERLTVLAYHRVEDPHAPTFAGFRPNVSATPAAFARQLDWLREHFNVIPLARLLGWLRGEDALPPRALLITFDDGYEDNYRNAWPLLRERNLPAVIFLTTDHIGSGLPFYWDRVAWGFTHTPRAGALLPLLGECRWDADVPGRDAIARRWIASAKSLPNDELLRAQARLFEALEVEPNDGRLPHCMDWDQVREMAAAGIAFGAHTRGHVILSRIPLEEAGADLAASKAAVEQATGLPCPSFAYPNGQRGDYGPAHFQLLRDAGFEAAFTLEPAPARQAEVREQPMAIRRTLIGHDDGPVTFQNKVLGLNRAVRGVKSLLAR